LTFVFFTHNDGFLPSAHYSSGLPSRTPARKLLCGLSLHFGTYCIRLNTDCYIHPSFVGYRPWLSHIHCRQVYFSYYRISFCAAICHDSIIGSPSWEGLFTVIGREVIALQDWPYFLVIDHSSTRPSLGYVIPRAIPHQSMSSLYLFCTLLFARDAASFHQPIICTAHQELFPLTFIV
jgi:hypothetical protein